jgi:hypothetical protein
MNREQKLQLAKEKLNTYQKKRTQGYSLQQALTNTTVNGQPLQGLGVASSTTNLLDDNMSYKSVSSLYSKNATGFAPKSKSVQGLDIIINDMDRLNIHDPKYIMID